MAETKVYALDEGKNQRETMTREQIVTAIQNMAATGSPGNVDDAFITKIKELNKEGQLRFWVGTMAEYNALEKKEDDVLYIFSDDPTVQDIEDAINAIEARVDDLGFKKGSVAYSGFSTPSVNGIEKQGKMALLNFRAAPTSWEAARITVPAGYRPAEDVEVAVRGTRQTQGGGTLVQDPNAFSKATLRASDGVIDLSGCGFDGAGGTGVECEIANAGWRIA